MCPHHFKVDYFIFATWELLREIFHVLSMNDFLPGCLLAVVVIKCFWSECVMSVLGTTKHSSCNRCIDTWQYSYIVFILNWDGIGGVEGGVGLRRNRYFVEKTRLSQITANIIMFTLYYHMHAAHVYVCVYIGVSAARGLCWDTGPTGRDTRRRFTETGSFFWYIYFSFFITFFYYEAV